MKNKLEAIKTKPAVPLNPQPKKSFPYYKFVIYSFLFVILMLPVIIVIGQTLNPYEGIHTSFKGGVPSSSFSVPLINPTANCTVTNVNTEIDYMVPFRHDFEWEAFKSWTSSGAKKDLTYDCGGTCVALQCTQKEALAAINQGFNCGLQLADGCGKAIDCTDNCAANEVCAVGAIGSDCSIGQLHMCDQGETIGHCRVDNSCYPVVDVPALGGPYGRMGCLISGPYLYREQACAAGQATALNALYYRSINCYVGNFTGGSMNTCSGYFLGNENKYYVIGDTPGTATLPPLITYSYAGIPTGINQCPPDEDPLQSCIDQCLLEGHDLSYCETVYCADNPSYD